MSREPVRRGHSGDLQHQAEHTRPRKGPSVLNYLVVLFMVAFLLLLIAYFQQQRQSAEATDDAMKQSTSALQSIQNLLAENDKLRSQVEDLEDQLSAKDEELTQATRATQQEQLQTQAAQDQVYALNCLNKLRYLYNNNRAAAKSYLAELGSEAGRVGDLLEEVSASLSSEDLAVYDPKSSWDQLVAWLS